MKLTTKILLTNLLLVILISVITPFLSGSLDTAFITSYLMNTALAVVNLIIATLLGIMALITHFKQQTSTVNYASLARTFLLSTVLVVLLAVPACFITLSYFPLRLGG